MNEIEIQRLHTLSKTELIAIIVQQFEIIKKLESRISALEKNSTNSSKPPSTDFQTKSVNRSLRGKTGKKSGDQPGHTGTTRMQVPIPDIIITCHPVHCSGCGSDIKDCSGTIMSKRQVADIPPIKLEITEYQQISVVCSCGYTNRGSFPTDVTAPLTMGHNLKAIIIYLNVAHHIPFDRCTQILDDLLSVRLSEGTIDSTLTQAYEKAQNLCKDILKEIKKGSWVGGDETGTHVHGQKWWQWVWQNTIGSYYAIEPGRGYSVVKDHFGEDYTGTMIHDCWSAQNNTVAGSHQHCHPHYLRDLQFCIETEQSFWAYEVFQFLRRSERAREVIWQSEFDPLLRNKIILSYVRRLQQFIDQPVLGKQSQKIQNRMRKHSEKILYFMNDSMIPFHNNSSEQAIRNAKIHKKVSGGFRSAHGAGRHAVLLTIIETCKKQKRNILESLKLLLRGELSFEGIGG